LKHAARAPLQEGTKRTAAMNFNKPDILELLAAQAAYIVREGRGARFDKDTLVLKTADGHDLEIDLGGFAYHPVEVSPAVFADLERSGAIYADGKDACGCAVYRCASTALNQAA
jgi:hypothetical protein